MRWLPARAHDNGIFLVFSNGVGVDDDEVRTGNAMVIDPYGRVEVATAPFEQEWIRGSVRPITDRTLYARFGDLFGWLCVLVASAMALRRRPG